MSDTLIHKFDDGHELLRDRRQWIVNHPKPCQNAMRGNLSWQRAKQTYFRQDATLLDELKDCGLSVPVALLHQKPTLAESTPA